MRSEKLNDDALHELEVIDAVVRGGGEMLNPAHFRAHLESRYLK